jgi:hypothetical protein
MLTTLAFSGDDAAAMGLSIPIIAVTGGLLLCIVSVIAKSIRRAVETKHKEESRREIAAYVAEGSMSPDDAYKLLSAGADPKGKSRCC